MISRKLILYKGGESTNIAHNGNATRMNFKSIMTFISSWSQYYYEKVMLSWSEYFLKKIGAVIDKSPFKFMNRKSKCFNLFGCFQPIRYLVKKKFPLDGRHLDVKFKLFTRQNPSQSLDLLFNDLNKLKESNFNHEKETKVIVHGFGGNCEGYWPMDFVKRLLIEGDYNVFCLDWSKGAKPPYYVQAAANTQMVGKLIAMFFELVNKNIGFVNNNTHLIGFSLGAHVVGYAGSLLPHLKRISGLDPAGPGFTGQTELQRLDPSDAKFVDVIHSNGLPLYMGGAGTVERMGHVDFYPNGGKLQKGCPRLSSSIGVTDIDDFGLDMFGCHHYRAYLIYLESFSNSCQLIGSKCKSWSSYQRGHCSFPQIPVGIKAFLPKNGGGSYYFNTRDGYPYCGRQYLVSMHMLTKNGRRQGCYGTFKLHNTKWNETMTLSSNNVFAPGIKIITMTVDMKFNFNEIDQTYLIYDSKARKSHSCNMDMITIYDYSSDHLYSWSLNATKLQYINKLEKTISI
ncbi:inactive pancreatic lipase-related protein 1 isoform X2 [Lepeophtheirus salmonis]|uniref:inactive pancreatic lipase-related protein 1 isoform X2 n=1 Tax=Lepeophtheirus salmonis TaxID=72036 RepID=UPI003AF370AA